VKPQETRQLPVTVREKTKMAFTNDRLSSLYFDIQNANPLNIHAIIQQTISDHYRIIQMVNQDFEKTRTINKI
jgi:hypothetical protein